MLLRHRICVLVLFCFMCAGAVLVAGQSRTDMSTLSFFPDGDAELIRMAEALHMAPFSRLLMVDFSFKPQEGAEGGPHQGQSAQALMAHAQAVLAAIPQHLAVQATSMPVLDPAKLLPLVPALTDAQALAYLEKQVQEPTLHAAMHNAKMQLGQLWGSFSLPWLQHDPLHFRQILLSRLPAAPSFGALDASTGLAVSADGKHVLLMLRPAFSMHEVEQAATLMKALDTALEKYVPVDVQVVMTGAHRHSAANAATIEADIQRIVIWSLLGFAVVYALFVRSVTGALWLLITPLVAGALAWGAVALIWPLIAGLALGFGASILGIAEDYAMHMHFALRHARGRGESFASVLGSLALPICQAFALNAAGFSVLLFSTIPALRQLAAFALFTLAAGLFFALVILPLWKSFASPPLLSSAPCSSLFMMRQRPCVQDAKTQGGLSLRVVPAILSLVTLLALCAFLWKSIPVDVSPQSMGADVVKIRQDMQYMQDIWGQGEPALYVVQGNSAAQALEHTQKLVQALEAAGHKADALSSVWPSAQEVQANIRRWQDFVARHASLPHAVQELALAQGFTEQTFAPFASWLQKTPLPLDEELFTQAGLGPLVSSFLEQGKNSKGDTVYFSLVLLQDSQEQKGVTLTLSEELQAVSVRVNAQQMEQKLLHYLEQERYLFPITGFICVLLLLLFSPQKKDILLAALPPLVAITGILLVMAWQGSALTLASMAALPLVLGLAVDHGIIMTHELTQGKQYGVKRAVVASSCTAILGMGLLMLADHPALHSMGQVIVAGLVVEMPVALWILPLFYTSVKSKETQG